MYFARRKAYRYFEEVKAKSRTLLHHWLRSVRLVKTVYDFFYITPLEVASIEAYSSRGRGNKKRNARGQITTS
ncbi:hypothetical protein ACLOAU_21395 [Niabella sp. CJ426]|uniref:hypothetical protein n=1 Tax=Niabella sp. CJ426 TaxID=3393740 RepID=UPI003D0825F9